MWAKRAEQLTDLHSVVDLDPLRCLDTADFLARHARRYGIRADLEFRRNHSGHVYDRHFVLCHHAGPVRPLGGPADSKPLWIMQFVTSVHHPEETRIQLGLHTYRRWGRGVEAGRAAQQYRDLLGQALSLLDEQKRQRPPRDHPNVIALRPYSDLPPIAAG